MAESPSDLLGKFLRLRQMVSVAEKTRASEASGKALVDAYNYLLQRARDDLKEDTRIAELDSWSPLPDPPVFTPHSNPELLITLSAAATEALLKLNMLGAWLDGLIEHERINFEVLAEAQAKAERENKPPMGFGQNP